MASITFDSTCSPVASRRPRRTQAPDGHEQASARQEGKLGLVTEHLQQDLQEDPRLPPRLPMRREESRRRAPSGAASRCFRAPPATASLPRPPMPAAPSLPPRLTSRRLLCRSARRLCRRPLQCPRRGYRPAPRPPAARRPPPPPPARAAWLLNEAQADCQAIMAWYAILRIPCSMQQAGLIAD